MAPIKFESTITTRLRAKIALKSQNSNSNTNGVVVTRAKRKADISPTSKLTQQKTNKRRALCDLTTNNALVNNERKKPNTITITKGSTAFNNKTKKPSLSTRFVGLKGRPSKPVPAKPVIKAVAPKKENIPPPSKVTNLKATINGKVKTRLSDEFDKNQMKIKDNRKGVSSTNVIDMKKPVKEEEEEENRDNPTASVSLITHEIAHKLTLTQYKVPSDVIDFDKENWDDTNQVSRYAMDIFTYLRSRESLYPVVDYMSKQSQLNTFMRSLLIDWMVDIQENFELNHETLYLGVKLVDTYLGRVTVTKETLQLVGAASVFIASKYDERMPPLIDDFLYICDGAYTRKELLRMEMSILKVCGYNLGFPISYRFLRRYSRCAKATMPVLTLARYILEYSLMDYRTVTLRDSVLAAAALYLSLRMKCVSEWTPTLEYYTGYKLTEIIDVARMLNEGLSKRSDDQLMTVRNKYSHKVFFEVAKLPLLTIDQLKLLG